MSAPEEGNAQLSAGVAGEGAIAGEAAPMDAAAKCRRVKRIILLVLLGIAFCAGVADGIFGESRATDFVVGVAFALLCTGWCYYDASEHGGPFPRWLSLLVLFVLGVGFPVYAFKSRGWAGFKLFGGGLLFLVATAVVYGVPAILISWLTGSE